MDDRPADERSATAPRENHLRVERTARYYASGGGEDTRELWFVLHGYGQLARAFLRHFTVIAEPSRLVVAPEALSRFYLVSPGEAPASERPVGASWMTREDRESEIDDYVCYLDALAAALLQELPQRRQELAVRVLGYSQGAATATRWVTRGRVPARQLILWGGSLPPEIDLAHGGRSFRGAALTIVAGMQDTYLTPTLVLETEERLRAHGVPYELRRYPGGHQMDREVLRAIAGAPAIIRDVGDSGR